jgi:SagB-type dehydrogenase family enzyme
MQRTFPFVAALVSAASALALDAPPPPEVNRNPDPPHGGGVTTMSLPAIVGEGPMTLDGALARRRSVRSFAVASSRALTPNEIGRLVWAAQGITDRSSGGRTAPSAGALYPLEVYAVLPEGVFRYAREAHALERVGSGDRRGALARAAHNQNAVRLAAIDIILTGVTARTAQKYGARAERYVLLEAGHAAQNVLLEAVGLGLGAVPIGAFDDVEAARVVGLSQGESVLCILPIGVPAS